MIMTLTGANSWGWQAKLKQITGDFIKVHGDLGLERLDGQETSLERLKEALTSLPLLADKKLVILRTPSAQKDFSEQAEQILDTVPETTEVVIVEPKLDKRLSYYKFLKKNTDFLEFAELDQNGLSRWLAEVAKGQAGSLNLADARYLVERVGANQQLLSNELEKLLLYDLKVTRQTIGLLTEPTPQSSIFQLLEAAFAGRTKTVLKLYAEQRAMKVEPPQIIAMLTWQLHVLAIIKTAGEKNVEEIAKEAKLNPFVVRKSQLIASKLTLTELKKLIADLLSVDIKTKSIAIDADEALQHYLLKLAL